MIVVDDYTSKCQFPDCHRKAECIIADQQGKELSVCRRCRKIVIYNLESYDRLIRPNAAANAKTVIRPESKAKAPTLPPLNRKGDQQTPQWLRDAAAKAEAAASPLASPPPKPTRIVPKPK